MSPEQVRISRFGYPRPHPCISSWSTHVLTDVGAFDASQDTVGRAPREGTSPTHIAESFIPDRELVLTDLLTSFVSDPN